MVHINQLCTVAYTYPFRCSLCFIAYYAVALLCRIELEIQGGLSPRPMMSVPHILADESSCYYHGYVLAEMSVHQVHALHYTKLLTVFTFQHIAVCL
jgi:hypothetical protein